MAKSHKLDKDRKKGSKFYRSTGHSNEDCYAQKSDMTKPVNFDNDRKRWCNTPREAIRMTNIVTRKEIVNVRTVILLTMESDDESHSPPVIGLSFSACPLPFSDQADGFKLLVDSGSSKYLLMQS